MRELEFITKIIRQAGQQLREKYFSLNAEVISRKSAKDLVTSTDSEIERYISTAIENEYPNDSIVGEEATAINRTSGRRWIIDPIDGTTNFIHRIPFFSISIALYDGPTGLLGLVYNPVLDELYHAVRGGGAFLNDRAIHVTETDQLVDALVVTGFACLRADLPHNNLKNFTTIAAQVRGILRFGSAALDLCSVACGRTDAFWEMHLNPWDIAAGVLLVSEAGGTITDFAGNPEDGSGEKIVATNGKLHDKICGILTSNEPTNS